jgi:hypothetical protein
MMVCNDHCISGTMFNHHSVDRSGAMVAAADEFS